MFKYFETLNSDVKNFFSIYSKDFPDFLLRYINSSVMTRLKGIGQSCGMDYTKLYDNKFFYSVLDHSVGVALITWHFTHDKIQTLASLFHDISAPIFKHVIDFLNNDHEKQESTEKFTVSILKNSKEISKLLISDGVEFEKVIDYKMYPICDNKSPRLSADRLEYTLSSGIYLTKNLTLDEIDVIYNDLLILKNEEGIDELGFRTLEIGELFIKKASKFWFEAISNRNKLVHQFMADLVDSCINQKLLDEKSLYLMTEKEFFEKLYSSNSKIVNKYISFKNATDILESDTVMNSKQYYSICCTTKRRYINPLVKTELGAKRISDVSNSSKKIIDEYLNFNTKKYAYLKI